MTFDSFNLDPGITAGIHDQGYVSPTPIQAEAIPPILNGRDLLGLAQTGTGKTAAFVLPLLQRLIPGPRRRVRALILAPTRELASQTHTAIQALGHRTRLRSAVIYGGVGMQPQIQALRGGCEIVVACPGRLLDHLAHKTIDLTGVETLVVDEADRMFDMGFLPDIRRILKSLPPRRQTLLFSATMPDDIRRLAADMLRDPVNVQIGFTRPVESVRHALYPVKQHLKTDLIKALLTSTTTQSVLVFTRTKHRAKRLAQQLEREGYRATSLQGNLSQNKREQAIDGFRNGAYQILVATDIAARGIDVSAISHVINYDMPDTADAYTHRIGRTGRASKNGEAFTFVTSEDAAMVRTIEYVLGEKLTRRSVPGFDYDKPQAATAAPPRPVQHRPRAASQATPPARGHARGKAAPARERRAPR